MWRDDEDRLRRAYLYAYQQITRYYTLDFIRRRHREAPEPPGPGLSHRMDQLPDGQLWGFHSVERWNEQYFRWTGAVGIVRLSVPRGTYRAEIDILSIRTVWSGLVRDAYFNGHPVAPLEMDGGNSRLVGQIHPWMFNEGDEQRLALVTVARSPFVDPAEARELGTPVAAVRLLPTPP
jgi:hypothetical protein